MPQFGNVTQGLRFRVVLKPGVALGPGKADLLQAIDETASLTAAAARFGMSYKRSWTLVQEMNAAFAKPLVETEKGGSGGGGGARLTRLGKRILKRYRQMEADAAKAVADGISDLRRHLKADAALSRGKGRSPLGTIPHPTSSRRRPGSRSRVPSQ